MRNNTIGSKPRRKIANGVCEPNRIRHFREIARLTQKALAKKVGTSQQQVQRIEAGIQSVRHDLALKICAVLGTSIGKVFPKTRKAVQNIRSKKKGEFRLSSEAPALESRGAVLVDATDLHDWAKRVDAPFLLPQLIRRLLLASVPAIEDIHFRSDEGVRLSGWDGVLRVSQGNAFAPPGISGWEMGTNEQVKGKADEDYDKRVTDSLGLQPVNSTFVFVTPRRWKNKEEWAQAKRSEGVWKDVRVLDADDLAAWLEVNPSVHIWFSFLIGKCPSGVTDLQTFWQTWSCATRPALLPDLLFAGRRDSVAGVQNSLHGPPSVLEIKADTREEARAFLAASILGFENNEERERVMARVIIVEDRGAWRQLAGWNRPLLLIPFFDDRTAVAEALARGHSVAIPLGGGEAPSRSAIVLPRLNRDEAKKALEKMGIPTCRAGELAALARRSMGALRRAIAVSASTLTPSWAEASNARPLIPAMLVGQWNDRSPGDQKVVSDLASKEYGEFTAILLRWANENDPPVRRVGDTWMFVSKEDGWSLLSRYLSTQDLERFESIALAVLSERDPEYELPLGERWEANLRGKVLKRSEELRKGVAETLAIMGSLSEVHPVSDVLSGQEWATRIVNKLLSQADDWSLWASLSPLLEFLAEAAPDALLVALERAISNPNKSLTKVFSDGETALFQGSPHTGLLWALEVLAWSSEYLAQTALILAKLAGLDPGGKLVNRPTSSLRRIFLCWYPATAANLDQRFRVIDMIRKRESNVAWDLLCSILPRRMDSAHPTAKPKWREWVPEQTPSVTYAEVFKATEEIIQRQLEDVGTAGSRWKDMIENLHEVRRPEFEKIRGQLESIDPGALTEADKVEIWASLREFVSKHRRFDDAQWALPSELVDRLDQLQPRFEPSDPIIKRAWLFSHDPDLPYKRTDDEYDKALEDAQTKSVEELYAQGGLSSIFKLADQVQCPWKVGLAVGASKLLEGSEAELLTQCLGSPNRSLQQLGMNYLIKRRSTKGQDWAVGLQSQKEWQRWTPQQRADYFRCLSFTDKNTWDALDHQDDETRRLYWSQVGPHGHGKLESQFCERVVEKFLEYGQLESAIEFLDLYTHGKESRVRPRIIVEVLSRIARASTEEIDWRSHGHRVTDLLEHLTQLGQIPDTELAQLEWYFLPFLRFDRRPITLYKALGDDPEFFVELLTFVYRAENQEPQEVTKEQQIRARYAHDLLSRWDHGPGLNADGSVSPEKLNAWIAKSRELASINGRLKAAEHQIGNVLIHYPPGRDGAWPHEAVRDLIEELASEEMESGISIGIFNSRGVITRTLDEGGKKERAIAERYKEYARVLRDGWPRTSILMKEIARSYEFQARREDLETEIRQDLWT